MTDCTCKPGLEATGWQEERCTNCLKAESDQWAEMMKNFDSWLDNLNLS